MREGAMKKFAGIMQISRAAVMTSAALVAFAGMLFPGAACAQGQDKSAPASSMQKLGRAPVNKEILRVQLPRPTVVKLKNGLTIVLEEDHKLPTVAFTMWIRPGQLADPSDLPGLASFTAGMLREGTEKRTSEQIAREVDSLGATLDASSRFGVSYTSVNASGLITDTAKILDLMSDVVLHPNFPASELAKFKQSEGATLEQRLSNPQFLAQQGFKRVVYGDTPMALASATKESIEKVSVEDLKRFHEKHYVPGNAILGVTGDFTASEMRATIEKYFGAWTGAAEAPEKFAAAVTPQATKITLVDRPASVQSFIIVGDRAIRRTDPEYYALDVMNQVLGRRAAGAAVFGPARRAQLDLWIVQPVQRGNLSGRLAGVCAGAHAGDGRRDGPIPV